MPCIVGLRDRALISVMTFARVSAVVDMDVEDYHPQGKRWWVRLHDKGVKRHEMPAHHTLEAYLDAYIEASGMRDAGKTPLFCSAAARADKLTEKQMNRVDAGDDQGSRSNGTESSIERKSKTGLLAKIDARVDAQPGAKEPQFNFRCTTVHQTVVFCTPTLWFGG